MNTKNNARSNLVLLCHRCQADVHWRNPLGLNRRTILKLRWKLLSYVHHLALGKGDFARETMFKSKCCLDILITLEAEHLLASEVELSDGEDLALLT